MRSVSSILTWEFEIRPETKPPCLHIRMHLSISSLYANFEWKTTNRIQIYNVPKWFSSLSSFFRVDYESFFHNWKSAFLGTKSVSTNNYKSYCFLKLITLCGTCSFTLCFISDSCARISHPKDDFVCSHSVRFHFFKNVLKVLCNEAF